MSDMSQMSGEHVENLAEAVSDAIVEPNRKGSRLFRQSAWSR